MTNWLLKLTFIFCLVLFVHPESWAKGRSKKGAQGGHSIAGGLMLLASSTSQGGQGPEGSTILSQVEYNYHGSWWGAGVFGQFDQQGKVEKDTAVGPKLEAHWNIFFLELGYMLIMNRSFNDRSIAEQTGDGYYVGAGVRFSLGRGGKGGFFFQGSYKYRTQNVKKQDGIALSEPITQTDGYPLAGIGYKF